MASLIFLLMSTISWSRILTTSHSILWLPLDWWHSLITDFVCFWCSVSSPSHFPTNLAVSQRFQAISPLFLGGGGGGGGVWGAFPQKIEISKPLNVISSILGNKLRTKKCGSFFHSRKCSFHSAFNLSATQSIHTTNEQNDEIWIQTFAHKQLLRDTEW